MSNFYKSDTVGDEPIGAENMSAGCTFRLGAVPSATGQIFGCGAPDAAIGGWGIELTSTGGIRGFVVTADGVFYTPAATFTVADVGYDFSAILTYQSNRIWLWLQGVIVGTIATTGALKVPTVPPAIGARPDGTLPALNITLWGAVASATHHDGPGVRAWHENCKAHFNLIGDLPNGNLRKWSGEKAIGAPRLWKDSVTGASLIKQSSPVVLGVSSASASWGREQVVGLKSFTASNYYRAANVVDGPQTDSAGFWIAVLFRQDSLPTGSGSRLCGNCNGTSGDGGLVFYTDSTPRYNFLCQNGLGSNRIVATSAINSSYVGKVHVLHAVYDGGTNELSIWLNATKYGFYSSITSVLAPTLYRFSVGNSGNTTAPADQETIIGIAAGDGYNITPSEIADHWSAIKTSYDITTIPSKTSFLYSVKEDASAVPATWVENLGTSEDLVRAGTPVAETFTPTWGS